MGSLHKRPGSKWWRYQWTDSTGRTRTRTLKGVTDIRTAKIIASKIDSATSDEVHGITDPVAKKYARDGARPIQELVNEWRSTHVATGGKTAQHVREYHSLVTRLFGHAGMRTLNDVTPGEVKYAVEHQPRSRGKGTLSARTKNKTLDAVKSFGAWCRRNQKWRADLLEGMQGWNEDTDRRHQHVAYTAEEQRAILQAASNSRVRNGMTGRQREMFYAVAAGTGFRKSTILGLRPRDLILDPAEPSIVVVPTNVKNKKEMIQPITRELAASLADFVAAMTPDAKIFRPRHDRRITQAFRADVEAAGLSYRVDEHHYRDFHSWRNTYLTHIGMGGNLKVAQDMAGHSTPALTSKYMRPMMRDYRKALDHLPRPDAGTGEKKTAG